MLVEIGVVGKAHGIGGATHIFLYNPESKILGVVESVILQDASGQRTIRIAEMRPTPKSTVVVFEGISNRTDAERLKGAKILIPREMLPNLSDGEFYIADLIGTEAWDNDRLIGTVTSSRPQGDVEIITITGESTIIEVPLVDDFVKDVDINARKIRLTDTDLLPSFPSKKSARKPFSRK
jgi:16S rRNA processing protein RimM